MRVCKIAQKRAWQPTPVFLPGESHVQRNLVGYIPQGGQDLDMTEAVQHADASVYPPVGLIQPQKWHLPLPHGWWATAEILCWSGRSFPPAGDHCLVESKLQPESHYFPSVAYGLETYLSAEIITHRKQILCLSFFNHASETCIVFCQLSEFLGRDPLVKKTVSQTATMNHDVHKLDFQRCFLPC